MQGYDSASYGDAFAEVYDEWYGDVSDVPSTVAALTRLAAACADAPIVELGVGTGRLAIPLAEAVRPQPVIGIDSSRAMLDRLRINQLPTGGAGGTVDARLGDMVDDIPLGPLSVVFVAFNTFFNLGTRERQQACFDMVASRLASGGCFVIEAAVPDETATTGSHVEVRTIAADRVVLSIARYDAGSALAEGQFVEFTEAGGIRLRPWSVRYAAPDELDQMAAAAGLVLRDRWEEFGGHPYTVDSLRHVSVYTASSHPTS
ncbi:MAG: putative methyltransferase [Ilumatobacteraceae bacterium]|nr:putative methyltransferase [Ilumatobacteraceae bacterium]